MLVAGWLAGVLVCLVGWLVGCRLVCLGVLLLWYEVVGVSLLWYEVGTSASARAHVMSHATCQRITHEVGSTTHALAKGWSIIWYSSPSVPRACRTQQRALTRTRTGS